MKTDIYNKEAKKAGDIELSSVFEAELNNDLVHQVVVSMLSNKRQNTAHTKDRSEVRGGGKKPWKQKGTGRARHGSRRSPIWVGGGITFGPRNERNFKKKINKKMKNNAFFQVLAQKMRDGEILFVDSLNFEEAKTKLAKDFLTNVSKLEGFDTILTKKKNSAIIANTELNQNNIKAFSNFSNIKTEEFRKLSVLDLLNNKYLIIINPEEAMKSLEAKKK